MSSPAPPPTTAVGDDSKNVTGSETDPKPSVRHAGLDAALVKTLDYFRTSFMTHDAYLRHCRPSV